MSALLFTGDTHFNLNRKDVTFVLRSELHFQGPFVCLGGLNSSATPRELADVVPITILAPLLC